MVLRNRIEKKDFRKRVFFSAWIGGQGGSPPARPSLAKVYRATPLKGILYLEKAISVDFEKIFSKNFKGLHL